MGEVWRARDTRLGRDVALKILPKDFAESADRLRRFQQEAKTLAALNHPNILVVFDVGQHESQPYLVSELLEGKTLREELEGGRLSQRKALEYALQLAQGLAAAHAAGIVHRDLKPDNIFVTKDGRIKVLDFGLAKLKPVGLAAPHPLSGNSTAADVDAMTILSTRTADTEKPEGTIPGMVLGTPSYMSPEQVRGDEADPRSDIFAFGAILYEMLSGQRAFRRETQIETMNAILRDDPPELTKTNPNLSPAIERVVRRCLEKQADRRFQSASDLAFAIEAAGAERPKKKALPGAVALAVVALAGMGIWLYYFSGRLAKLETVPQTNAPPPVARAVESKSVTVLPFVNMSADKDNEYLSDGITEELCTALAQVRGLRVPARTSCFVFKGKTDDIQKIGQQLHVATVLEGSVSQSGQKLRITVQLINIADGFHLWATNYDREMGDLLALRSEIAKQVVAAMRVQLLPGEKEQLQKKGTENPEAHRLYLLGLSFWNQRTGDGLKKAIDYFEQALVKDPNYALAHVGLADCYVSLPEYAGVASQEAMSKADAAALTAIKLDDTLGEAHAALSFVRQNKWDWQGAEAEFRKAIELTPNYATAHHWYCIFLRSLGRFDEASREIQRAQELDPLSPVINANVGFVLNYEGHYDQAIAAYRTVLEVNPNFPLAHRGLGDAYLMKQMYSEAITEFQTARASAGNTPYGLGGLGCAYGLSGRVNEAGKVLDELTGFLQQGYEVQYDIALVYNGLGDREKTLDWLEKAGEAQTALMRDLKYDPLWQNLRSEPRFLALLKKMGLEK